MNGVSELFDLGGRVAVVTGGGRGLGRGIADGLASCGAHVVICGRSESTVTQAVDALKAAGHSAMGHVADVSREAHVESLRDAVLERFGRLDILVNNAGVNPIYAGIEAISLADWQHIIDVNLTGVFLCCKHLGQVMAMRGEGSVVNISSIAGHVGLRKTVPYCAAKGGVEQLTKALALDWAPRNVRVNSLAPGYFESDLTTGLRDHPHLAKRLLDHTPLGRFGTITDLVGAVMFLASPASAFMTGQSLVVDGGWTAD